MIGVLRSKRRRFMAEKSHIQWTDMTWNPWHGCHKVSPGCKFCYMYRDKDRYNQDPTTVLRSKSNFEAPKKIKEPRKIFTCSWSDWFIPEADAWRPEAWDVIRQTPHHTYQILTKRPERINDHLPHDFEKLENVWLGVSIESQAQVNRLDYIMDLPCVKIVSFEPLIGEIQWDERMNALDWVIIGGESGNEEGKYRYRPMELHWVDKLIVGARNNKVACFVKQLGTHQAKLKRLKDRHGGEIEEWPAYYQIREYPQTRSPKFETRPLF